MSILMRSAGLVALLGVAACDEVAVSGDPEALAELRGSKRCIAAVSKETGVPATLNTTEQVIEVNYYILDLPDGTQWTCVTDDEGNAREIVKRHP